MPVMVKHIDNALYQLLESLLGPLTTSLARKKARLIFADKWFGRRGQATPQNLKRLFGRAAYFSPVPAAL